MTDELDLDFEIPVREAGTGQIKRVTFGAAPVAKTVSPEAMADDVVRRAALSLAPDLQKRFREAVLARIKDVRDAIETREELVKAVDKGGLGLSVADAEKILKVTTEVMGGKGLIKAPEAPKVLEVPKVPKVAEVSKVPTVAKVAEVSKVPPVSKSIPLAQTPTPKPIPLPQLPTSNFQIPTSAPPIPRDEVFEKLAEEVIAESGISLPPDVRRRLVIALVARLKDVRDAAETKDYITRPVPAGGVGLQAVVAERVLASVNVRFSKITSELERIEKEKTLSALKKERDVEARRVEVRQAEDVMSRDELYASVVSKSKKVVKPSTDYGLQTTAPPSTQISNLKSQIPPTSPLKPKVIDVAPAVKLVGPVEELKAMTLADFRKLAKDPKEACLKIRDKINLLGEEGFAKRTAGTNAWRESEPMKLYAELTAGALQEGKAIPVQIQERTTTGKPTLTQDEFTAIMELNRILRF